MSRVMDRLGNRLPHQGGRTYAAIESRVVTHLYDGRNAAPLFADELSVGAMKLDLARRIRAIAEFVLQPKYEDRRCARRPASIAASKSSSSRSALGPAQGTRRTSAPT